MASPNKTTNELAPTKTFIGVNLNENFSSNVSSFMITNRSGNCNLRKNFFLFDSNLTEYA